MVNEDKDSLLYAVDRLGRVWYLNTQPKSSIGKSSLSPQESSAPNHLQWTLLPNPTRIDIKRVSSRNGVVWGIGSDHQIYIYVHRQDIPIRVREETFENERWNPVGGFCSQLLPTDRPHYSTKDGLTKREKSSLELLSDECWTWESDWQVENTFENEILDEGWTYAVDFPATYHPGKSWNSCVRRRKWFRIRGFVGFNKWLRIGGIHSDHTQEPFTDVSVNTLGSSLDITCVWTVTVLGQVYLRTGVTSLNPQGTHWEQVWIEKGLEACQVSVSGSGSPFVISWTGSALYRLGVTPHNLRGSGWVEVNGPPGGLLQVSAGEKSLWAISRRRKCWVLKGDLPKTMAKHFSNPGSAFEWSEIPGHLKSVSVNKDDTVVLAMSADDSLIFSRLGITPEQTHGQVWKAVFQRASWETLSTTSGESTSVNTVDQADSGKGDSVSISSLRPDFPEVFQFEESSESEENAVSLCWVDGGCLSSFKSGVEGDMEIGAWREEILTGIQSLKMREKSFPFANALDDDVSEWKGKSSAARMLQHGQDSRWLKGELEILNNDTLVFHKSLTHKWFCALRDVLSVLRPRDASNSFTLRIRNAIEAGVADFVSFKFSNDAEVNEWHHSVSELSEKNREEFTLGNVWLTTNSGELHECGLIKMADSPVGADAVLPSDGVGSSHHPLIKGFLPGSVLKIDISIPSDPERFILNLEGKDLVAFHFNPRFADAQVVRNTRRHGEWGVEERDGVFPFRPSTKYVVTLECIDTHFITTVCVERKTFIFKYKHRVLPKFITNFSASGTVSIVGIRYEPKTGENASQPEFVSTPSSGHFWKAESGPNGFVWAIGYDSQVWMHANGIRQKKTENEVCRVVTDDHACYIYENQRWNPLSGFGAHGLPTDRSAWSDETGRIALEKERVKLPSSKWAWVSDWEIDYAPPGGAEECGWQYAVDFPASYHPFKRINDFVRRRRWKRICRYSANGPWMHVAGVKLVDLCIQMNEECDWEVIGICENGDAVVRCGITPDCVTGTHWEPLPSEKPFISISGSYGQRVWAIGKDGFAYIRYGQHWQLLDRPKETPLKSVRVGASVVWAVGTNNALYKRSDILPIFPEGRDWIKVGDGVTQVSLGLGEEVWVLLKQGDVFPSTLARRIGISQTHPQGLGWEMIVEGPWTHFSLSGAFRRNR